jgi:phosphate-selective porin OprO/OprP
MYLLTGDQATFGTVVPNHPFRVDGPGWGAFEVAARISQLSLDSETFSTSPRLANSWCADPTTQASKARAWTLGVNWYLTQNVTRFDGGALPDTERPNESAFFTQFRVAFSLKAACRNGRDAAPAAHHQKVLTAWPAAAPPQPVPGPRVL